MKYLSSILPLLICSIFSHVINAQIKGTIIDNSKKPIEFATVIITENDSVFVDGVASDMNGEFILNMQKKSGNYILSITCIGFEKKQIPINLDEEPMDMGHIIIDSSSQQLSEIIIKANRIQRNAGGYSVNLQGEEAAKGTQANEMLKSLPGITLEDGYLKVLGQIVSVIYLDGIRIKDQKELETIPAELLQSAQIEYMASSKELASIKGAVIHLNLNRQREDGYFGNIMGGITLMTKYGFTGDNVSSVYNYRYKNLNFYNNFSYSDKQSTGDFEERKNFKDSGAEIYSTEEFRSWSKNFYNRLSLTYDLDKSKTFGNSFYISSNNASPINNIISSYFSDGETIPQKSSLKTPYKYTLYQLTSKFQWANEDTGSDFEITVDYLHNNENDGTEAIVFTDSLTPIVSKSHSRQRTNIVGIDTRLRKMLSSGSSFNIGANYRSIRSNYDLESILNMKEKSQSSGYMPALYSEFSGGNKKLQYELGLRIQQNKIVYKAMDLDKVNKKSDWGIYPSVNLLYMIDGEKGNLLMLSYKKSIDDIPYSAINPYKRYSSEYFYTTGNPNLLSPKQDMAIVSLDMFNKVTINGIYMYGRRQIYYATEVDSEDPLLNYTIPKNGKNETMIGIGIESRVNPSKWLKMKITGRFSLYSAETISFNVKNQTKYYFSINNNLTLTKSIGATLDGYYEPTFKFTDRVYHTVYELKGSLYKKFLNDKLESRLNFKLLRKGRILETETPEFWSSSANSTNEQYFQLSFIYFFKGGKKVNVKRTTNILEYKKIEDTK